MKLFGAGKKTKKGEPLVWLCSMGLALGLLMVFGLMGVIVVNGFEAFWPRRVVQIQLKSGVANPLGAGERLAGEIVRKQTKKERAVDADPLVENQTEWQLFVGNKDVYGQSFLFIDAADVASTTQPSDLMNIERLEYGDALVYPQAIRYADGKTLDFGRENFDSELKRLTAESVGRWKQIHKIEKDEIGGINRRLEKLNYQIRAIESEPETGEGAAELKALQEANQKLQSEYEALAAKARELRSQQGEVFLLTRLASGQEKEISFGQILHTYYPNRLTYMGRVALSLHNVWIFIVESPREANTEGGIFPAIFGTVVMTVLMSLMVTPFGVMAAVYLREYARQGPWVRMVRIAINNLAGVPSIVFGVFGLGFFVYLMGGTIDSLFFSHKLPTPTFGTGGIMWASLTLALMTVPVVIVATEEALAAVGQGMREASLACGASKWQTIQRIVLPAAAPGILTGMVLAMARGAGEVAPLMLVGVVKLAPELPINGIAPYFHLDQKFMHLGFHIYDLGFQSPDSEAAKPMVFATTLLLIALVFTLNAGAILVRERLRRKYSSGVF